MAPRKRTPRPPSLSGDLKSRLRSRTAGKKATATAAATGTAAAASAAAAPVPDPAAAAPTVPVPAASVDAEAQAHSVDQQGSFLQVLPLELLFAVAVQLTDKNLVALALASRRVHGLLCERLDNRCKTYPFVLHIPYHPKLTDRRFGTLVHAGALQWAARCGHAALLGRLLTDMDALQPPLVNGPQGCFRRHNCWGEPSLLLWAALSGDDDTMRLVLARSRHVPGIEFSTPHRHCSNERVFRLLADEASRRLK